VDPELAQPHRFHDHRSFLRWPDLGQVRREQLRRTLQGWPGSAFSVGELVVTLMAGPEPAMRAERAYLTLLAQARSYEVADGTLTLYDGGGNESLIFEVIHA